MIGWISGIFQARAQRQAADFSSDVNRMMAQQHTEELRAALLDRDRLQRELDRKSAMPGDYRYWEGRYRDEAAENAKLSARANEAVKAANALQIEVDQLRAQLANAETDGPKRDLEKSNDAQAARAMARNTKNDFVEYQKGVINVLAQFDAVMSKNSITKADLETINNVRRQMRDILRRQI